MSACCFLISPAMSTMPPLSSTDPAGGQQQAAYRCLPRVPHLPRDQAGGGAPPLPPPDRVALRCTWILYLDPAPSSLSLQACYPSTTRLKRVRCLISVLKGCSFIGPSIVICTYASSERTTALAPPSNPNKTWASPARHSIWSPSPFTRENSISPTSESRERLSTLSGSFSNRSPCLLYTSPSPRD